MYAFFRPLLFSLNAETAHRLALNALNYLPSCFFPAVQSKPFNAMGLCFPNRIGLAAGLDKNGAHLAGLAKLGFGFIEVGTVTPKPQEGNPKPRLFRLLQAEGLINRMGFNNAGVDELLQNLTRANYNGILGINIGKNKDTSLNHAAEDYLICLRKVYPYASYVTINISSPNTQDLRQLQHEGYLGDLLAALYSEQLILADRHQRQVPLLVKISPDESPETIKHVASEILKYHVAGVIATNTTCQRPGLQTDRSTQEQGGLSGRPICSLSTECLKMLRQLLGDTVTLIGVGGIADEQSARAKLEAGASLLQLYTGLIYHGPQLVARLAQVS